MKRADGRINLVALPDGRRTRGRLGALRAAGEQASPDAADRGVDGAGRLAHVGHGRGGMVRRCLGESLARRGRFDRDWHVAAEGDRRRLAGIVSHSNQDR